MVSEARIREGSRDREDASRRGKPQEPSAVKEQVEPLGRGGPWRPGQTRVRPEPIGDVVGEERVACRGPVRPLINRGDQRKDRHHERNRDPVAPAAIVPAGGRQQPPQRARNGCEDHEDPLHQHQPHRPRNRHAPPPQPSTDPLNAIDAEREAAAGAGILVRTDPVDECDGHHQDGPLHRSRLVTLGDRGCDPAQHEEGADRIERTGGIRGLKRRVPGFRDQGRKDEDANRVLSKWALVLPHAPPLRGNPIPDRHRREVGGDAGITRGIGIPGRIAGIRQRHHGRTENNRP